MVEAAEQNIGQHVEAPDQIELLEYHGSVTSPGPQRRAAQGGDVALLAQDTAFGRVGEAVEHAQQRRLAGARAADHADHLAARNRQGDVVDGGLAAETLGQTLDTQHQHSPAIAG